MRQDQTTTARPAALALLILVAFVLPAPLGAQSVASSLTERVLGALSFPTTAESEEAQAAFIQGML